MIGEQSEVTPDRCREFHLIETMRHQGAGVVKSLDAHLERASNSARYFGFEFNATIIRSALAATTKEFPSPSRVRILVYSDGRFAIDLSELPAPRTRSVRLGLDSDPMDTATCWSRHKTSLREPYAKRRASMTGADDVVIQNERGDIMETCTGNIAVFLNGRWCTPPLSSGCLPGIERMRLLHEGTLRECVITVESFLSADRIAVINSLRGWRPAIVVASDTPFDLTTPLERLDDAPGTVGIRRGPTHDHESAQPCHSH